MNKKLIKILACYACGLGIATSIPFMATSCGSPAKGPMYEGTLLPDDAYDIDEATGTLKGFKSDINWKDPKYADANVMKLPKGITYIGTNTGEYDQWQGAFTSKIPANITILDLSNLTEQTELRAGAFKNNESITLLVMPSKIKSIGYYALDNLSNVATIYWDWSNFNSSVFHGNYEFGVKYDSDGTAGCIAYSLSKKSTQEFKQFLDYFITDFDSKPYFEHWQLKQY